MNLCGEREWQIAQSVMLWRRSGASMRLPRPRAEQKSLTAARLLDWPLAVFAANGP